MENEMSEEARRKWDRRSAEFRQRALERMKTCQNVKALAKELGVARQQLYWWRQQAERRQKPSEPGATEDPRDRRIRELEKKVGELQGCIGQKTLELDFFAGALRRIEESRRKRGKPGATASTPKSAVGCNRKVD
jgi:transposase-like protein